jgi:hypothetical protein
MATGNIACVATLARAKAQGKKLGRLAGSLVGKQNEKYRRRFDCCRSNYHFSRDVELFHEVEALCANYFFSIVVISYGHRCHRTLDIGVHLPCNYTVTVAVWTPFSLESHPCR